MRDWIYDLWIKEQWREGKQLSLFYATEYKFDKQLKLHFKKEKMNLETYQAIIEETAIYPKQFGLGYTTLGLVGEFQEFCQARTDKERLKEFGDVCWYLTATCKELGIQVGDVFPHNYAEKNAVFPGASDSYFDSRHNVNVLLGRLCEITKKHYRDFNVINTAEASILLFSICSEICQMAQSDEIDIQQALETNYNKLLLRKEKGMLQGSGSDREES